MTKLVPHRRHTRGRVGRAVEEVVLRVLAAVWVVRKLAHHTLALRH